MSDYAALGRAIAVARKARGFTQISLSKKLKRPNSWIAKIETGDRRLDLIEFHQLARALGASAADLLTELFS